MSEPDRVTELAALVDELAKVTARIGEFVMGSLPRAWNADSAEAELRDLVGILRNLAREARELEQ